MASAIPWAASGIGGLLSSIGRAKGQTSSSSSESTGTQEANLSGKQRKVNKALFQQILEALKMGPQVSQADRNVARGQINDTYNGATTNLESNLAARGFGESGKFGAGLRDMSIARAKAFQNTEATLRDQAQNRFMQMLQAGFQFDQPRSFTSSSSGTQTGTQGGTPWQSSLGGGLGDLSSLLFLKQMGGLGAAAPYCWVARAVYGENDWRALAVMSWLARRARRAWRWRVVTTAYRLTGRQIARGVRKSDALRGMFKRLFDRVIAAALSA